MMLGSPRSPMEVFVTRRVDVDGGTDIAADCKCCQSDWHPPQNTPRTIKGGGPARRACRGAGAVERVDPHDGQPADALSCLLVPVGRRSRSSSCVAGSQPRARIYLQLQDPAPSSCSCRFLLHPGRSASSTSTPRRHERLRALARRAHSSKPRRRPRTSMAGRFGQLHQSTHHHPTGAHARPLAAGLAARMRLVAQTRVLSQGHAQALATWAALGYDLCSADIAHERRSSASRLSSLPLDAYFFTEPVRSMHACRALRDSGAVPHPLSPQPPLRCDSSRPDKAG